MAQTSSLDIALRFVNSALHGHHNVDAYLDAPDNFSKNVRSCSQLARAHVDLEESTRLAVLDAIAAAETVYKQRNRYMHDFLREDLLSQGWELARLTRQPDEMAESMPVSFDDMVTLVLELTTVTWRLRGCGLYVLGGQWEAMALGTVQGLWDGKATTSR
ncbi:hypothetical protein [Cryobacterium soli]|uniref:hypothetical protein n=1 Tax=Cryobacterium soli TaxID=2220095 RepID=UPI0013C49629|nr:hypothetical protein [Cryobacterium soli]